MTIDINLQTGDKTYVKRVERYNYIQQRLADRPKPTLEQIGKELGITKQNVSRLLQRGTVRPSGRPPTNEGRRQRILRRLELWQSRRLAKLADGKDVTFENGWIDKLEARLQELK